VSGGGRTNLSLMGGSWVACEWWWPKKNKNKNKKRTFGCCEAAAVVQNE